MKRNIKYIIIGIIILLFPAIAHKVITHMADYLTNAIPAVLATLMNIPSLESIDAYILFLMFWIFIIALPTAFIIAFVTESFWKILKAFIGFIASWAIIFFFAVLFKFGVMISVFPQKSPYVLMIWLIGKVILIIWLYEIWTILFPSLRGKTKEQTDERTPEQMNNETINKEAVDPKGKTAGEKE